MDPNQPILKIMKPNDTYSHRNLAEPGSSCRRGKAILNWSDRAGVEGKYPATWKFWLRHKPLLAETARFQLTKKEKYPSLLFLFKNDHFNVGFSTPCM